MAFTTNSIEGYYNPDLGAPGYDQIFALTLLVYDYLITIGDEIEYLWKRPKTRSSLWFFVTRYMGLVGNVIITILIFMDPPVASCDGVGLFKEVLLLITQGVIGIILALRVYALYGCSPRILAFIMGSAIVLVAIASWLLLVQPVIFDGRSTTGCGTGPSFKSSMRIAGAWEALLVYDCIIFGLTIFKTWSARPDYAMTGISIPLITLLLRDGAIYFA
ncbi:hypothetical protein D9619_010637 [Psilocybe cf. subviscida]|uniref:DUF6533 domain-containing protein n=1 Tax=Psilocybe cf. subviscida TaxID=2480587 RepID=A0A8H5B8P9_9AGAR|nr:hypothetical protein D9619_010637 [Psilocybe cf. subviscida]